MTLSANINYNLDSNHIITVELDSSLAEEIINTIGFKQIIKAKTLEGYYEYFVLTGVDKELDDIITLTGIHWLTETTSKIFCKDLKPRGLNANLMLKHIVEGSEEYKNDIQYAKDIETSGNIDTLANCNLWQTSLGDYLEDLQELYGKCEVRKRGFTLSLMDYVGSRTPRYTVNYGENLISSTTSEEYILVKGILPTGYDGIRGNIVYSEKISSGITKVIEYPVRLRVEGKEDEESYSYYNTLEECQKALEDLAKKEFEVNKIDEIVITYDIKFLDLATTVEEGNGEKTYLTVGDVVNTRIDKYNLDINTRVVEMDYDVLEEEIKDVVLSNAAISYLKVPTLNSVNKEIEKKPTLEEVISITKLESTNILNAGMKNSYVVVKKVINDDGTVVDGEILVMDSPNVDNAVNVWRWNKNGLMHSNSGYNGTYTMGLRYDGLIFADLIRAGTLKSFNEKSWINLEDGTFNFADKIRFDGTNDYFNLGNINGGGAYHSSEYSKWNHADGSYSKISANGLERYEGKTKTTYHYYIKTGTILMNSGDQVYIEAPNHILAKEGVVIAVEQYVSPHTNNYIYSLNTCLITPFYEDGRVMIQARIKWNNLNTKQVEEGGFVYVHYLIVG